MIWREHFLSFNWKPDFFLWWITVVLLINFHGGRTKSLIFMQFQKGNTVKYLVAVRLYDFQIFHISQAYLVSNSSMLLIFTAMSSVSLKLLILKSISLKVEFILSNSYKILIKVSLIKYCISYKMFSHEGSMQTRFHYFKTFKRHWGMNVCYFR